MSGKLVGQVYEIVLSHGQQAVLVAMADHGSDDGSHVFPAVDYLAWKTGYNRRHVQRMLRELEAMEVLVEVAPATRRLPTEYRIDVAAGTRKPPYERDSTRGDIPDTRGDICDTEGRHSEHSGVTPRPPEPSEEPSGEPTTSSRPSDIETVHDHYVSTMRKRGKAAELREDERRIIRDALAAAEVDEVLACITACERSDYHMKRGKHANRKGGKYNSLGKILKPRPRHGETARSRIDWWLERAAEQDSGQAVEFDMNAEADRIAKAQGLD